MRANHASVPPMLGIIGGSGIYDVEGLSDVRWEAVDTPYGSPSDELMFGTLDGFPIVFLPRHGRGHRVPPSELNFRANIHALKRVGVTEVVSLSAVGSLREDLVPGTFVVVTSSSIEPSRGSNPSSNLDLSPMSQLPIPSAGV